MIQNDLMPLPPLEIGDFIPPFAMHDDGGQSIDRYLVSRFSLANLPAALVHLDR